MTDEQMYWHCLGYYEALICSISIDMNIPEREVRKWVIEKMIRSLEKNGISMNQ